MASFFSLFHCETSEGNRGYENRFQWFVVSSSEEQSVRHIERIELEELVTHAKDDPLDHAAAISLARLLGISLERKAYELFLEEIGMAAAIAIFYDDSVGNSEGFTDFRETKDSHYQKYCLFKFASFLDLLCPGFVHWRGQAELDSESFICTGLDRFQAADLQGRTSMLSRWIQNLGYAAFSEKMAKQSERMLKRRAFLLTLGDSLAAAMVARRLDEAGLKPGRKYLSYTVWFQTKPKSFESWLSRERAESRRVWKTRARALRKKSKLS